MSNRLARGRVWVFALLLTSAATLTTTAIGDPLHAAEARTPETRTLTAEEAKPGDGTRLAVSGHGRTADGRAAKEIVWARELAGRLARVSSRHRICRPSCRSWTTLEKRLAEMRGTVRRSQPDRARQSRRAGAELDLVSRGQAGRGRPGRHAVLSLPLRTAGRRRPRRATHRGRRRLRSLPQRHAPRARTRRGSRPPSSRWETAQARPKRPGRAAENRPAPEQEPGRADRPPGRDPGRREAFGRGFRRLVAHGEGAQSAWEQAGFR